MITIKNNNYCSVFRVMTTIISICLFTVADAKDEFPIVVVGKVKCDLIPKTLKPLSVDDTVKVNYRGMKLTYIRRCDTATNRCQRYVDFMEYTFFMKYLISQKYTSSCVVMADGYYNRIKNREKLFEAINVSDVGTIKCCCNNCADSCSAYTYKLSDLPEGNASLYLPVESVKVSGSNFIITGMIKSGKIKKNSSYKILYKKKIFIGKADEDNSKKNAVIKKIKVYGDSVNLIKRKKFTADRYDITQDSITVNISCRFDNVPDSVSLDAHEIPSVFIPIRDSARDLSDSVFIVSKGNEFSGEIVTIKRFNNEEEEAETGDNVELEIRIDNKLLDKTELSKLISGSTIIDKNDSRCRYQGKFSSVAYILRSDEGGRDTPFFNGYRPILSFYSIYQQGTIEKLPGEDKSIVPGTIVDLIITLDNKVALKKGMPFEITDDNRTIGIGTVVYMLEP